jgi:hypothetical protein
MIAAIWALWIMGGGPVNGGYLRAAEPVAYFSTAEECARVQVAVLETAGVKSRCIQAYYLPKP